MADRFQNWKLPTFDENGMTKWGWKCLHIESLKLGKNTDIGAFTLINAKYGVVIEDEVQIGGGCFIYSEDTEGDKRGAVIIKKGAKIGCLTCIMPGVTIGAYAVVGSNSCVKTDIEGWTTVAGVPAKVIK